MLFRSELLKKNEGQLSETEKENLAKTMVPINDVCRYTTVERKFAGGSRSSRLLCSNKLSAPNSKCFVCNKSEIDLYIDIHQAKFSLFLDSIIKKKLAFVEGLKQIFLDHLNTLYINHLYDLFTSRKG